MSFNIPPWIPITNCTDLKYLGKLNEELSELQKVISRIIIQGMDGVDPANNAINRAEFEKEIADVYAHLNCNIKHFYLMIDNDRIIKKIKLQKQWVDNLPIPKD